MLLNGIGLQATKLANGDTEPELAARSNVRNVTEVDRPDPEEPNGFDKNLTPTEILGATEVDGHILFLIQW